MQAGEYVSLGKVESALKMCPVVDNICVYGHSSKLFIVALVVPSPKHLKELAQAQGIPETEFEELCSLPAMQKAVLYEIAEYSRKCKQWNFENNRKKNNSLNFLFKFQANYKKSRFRLP